MNAEQVWCLHHGGRVVARLQVSEPDFPWLNATVERRDGFDDIAPLFEDELRLLDEIDGAGQADWEAAYGRIRTETRLTDPDGREVPEYLLHIQGDYAWWRWSDEPFPDERR